MSGIARQSPRFPNGTRDKGQGGARCDPKALTVEDKVVAVIVLRPASLSVSDGLSQVQPHPNAMKSVQEMAAVWRHDCTTWRFAKDPTEMSMSNRRSQNAENRMNIARLAPLWCAGFALIGALSGCATFEKCGFKGCPGDAQITAEVEALFDRHPELGTSIHVQTLDHVVYLYGLVDTSLDTKIAESVALAVPGVVRVVNSIANENS